jgi:hypothetical protein
MRRDFEKTMMYLKELEYVHFFEFYFIKYSFNSSLVGELLFLRRTSIYLHQRRVPYVHGFRFEPGTSLAAARKTTEVNLKGTPQLKINKIRHLAFGFDTKLKSAISLEQKMILLQVLYIRKFASIN